MKKTPAEFMKRLKSRLDEVTIFHQTINENIVDAMVAQGYGQPQVDSERRIGPHFTSDVVTEVHEPVSYIATFRRNTTEPRGSLASFVSTVKVQQSHTYTSPMRNGEMGGYVGPGIEHIAYSLSIGGKKFIGMPLEKLISEIENKLSPNDQSKQISEDDARKLYGFGELQQRSPITVNF